MTDQWIFCGIVKVKDSDPIRYAARAKCACCRTLRERSELESPICCAVIEKRRKKCP